MSAPCSFSDSPNAKIAPASSRSAARWRASALPLCQIGPRPEDRDLPGVPVGQAVEAGDLVERADPAGVPALVLVVAGLGGRGEQGREDLVLLHELEEVGVPGARGVLLAEYPLAARLEEVDGLEHQLAGAGVEVRWLVGARVEQQPTGTRLRRGRVLDTRHLALLRRLGPCWLDPKLLASHILATPDDPVRAVTRHHGRRGRCRVTALRSDHRGHLAAAARIPRHTPGVARRSHPGGTTPRCREPSLDP